MLDGLLGSWKELVQVTGFGQSFICHCCLVTKSCPTLLQPCGLYVPLQAPLSLGLLEWVAIPVSKGTTPLRNQTHISCIGRRTLYNWATRETFKIISLALNSPLKDLRGNRWTLSEMVQSLPPAPLAQVLLLFHQVSSQLKHSLLFTGLPENPGQV